MKLGKTLFLKIKISNLFQSFSRVAISAIFISDMPLKINGFERKVDYITLKGIPDPIASYLLVVAIICLILGSALRKQT